MARFGTILQASVMLPRRDLLCIAEMEAPSVITLSERDFGQQILDDPHLNGQVMTEESKQTPQADQPPELNLRRDFRYSGRPDWQKRLIEKYPEIYRIPNEESIAPVQVKEPLAEDYCNLRAGFECGPGWEALIEQVSSVADQLVTKLRDSGLQPDASIKAAVVKQKLGELRWQGRHNLSSPFDTLWLSYLIQIGSESTRTCEISGEVGKMRHLDGLIICLSNREFAKWRMYPREQSDSYWQFKNRQS